MFAWRLLGEAALLRRGRERRNHLVRQSAVLGFMDRLAVEQQLIICTDDLRIVTWARLEAMTGNAALIDVNPGRAHSGAGSVAPS